jgi:hypothetical protein
MMMSENQLSQSQAHLKVFGVLRFKRQKAGLNRQPGAYTCGRGGAWFSPNTSHMMQKRTVNATLRMGHQADPAHCYISYITDEFTVHNIIQHYFWDWGQ